MRIGIDARFYGPIGKGLGRYTQKLIENLEKIDKNNRYFIFLRKNNFDAYQPKNNNFKKVLADFKWYTVEEQLKFPKLLKAFKLDICHFPHFNVPFFYSGKFVVTIHDLILIHFPTVRSSTLSPFLYWLKFIAYKIVIKSAILRSSRIIAVSNFTKDDLLKTYKSIPHEKIFVTYEACEDYCMLSPNKDKEILARYGIINPYIMYVGNAYPHKNLERLLLAFNKTKKTHENICLILVGSEDYFYKRLRQFSKREKIRDVYFMGYVPDHDLDTFFHNAEAFVWPSLYEGFGLPPLEAMAKGTPVVSSDHPCMKEILGDSAHYFKAENVESIAAAISEILSNRSLRQSLIAKGFRQAEKYSWKGMAKQTLDIYETIIRKQT